MAQHADKKTTAVSPTATPVALERPLGAAVVPTQEQAEQYFRARGIPLGAFVVPTREQVAHYFQVRGWALPVLSDDHIQRNLRLLDDGKNLINLDKDPMNCGAIGMVCAPGQQCVKGQCVNSAS